MSREQFIRPLQNQRGSLALVLALTVPLILVLVLSVTHIYRVMERRAHVQAMADAAALQAADAQARMMNMMAMTNNALLATMSLAGGTFITGHLTALALDAMILTLPEGLVLHAKTTEAVNKLRMGAQKIAEVQDRTVEFGSHLPPMLAAQGPLLLNRGEPAMLLLPYPLPGMNQDLSLALPMAERGFAISDFVRSVTSYLADTMADSMSSLTDYAGAENLDEQLGGLCQDLRAEEALREASQKAREDGSLAERARIGAVQAVNSLDIMKRLAPLVPFVNVAQILPSFQGTCKELDEESGDMGNMVLSQLADKLSGLMHLPGDGLTIRRGSVAGFPMPLLLQKDYTQSFQVGVIAVTCPPSTANADCTTAEVTRGFRGAGSPYFAISQARARSLRQNRGEGLFIPDFRARLVPVDMSGGADTDSGAGGLLEEGPWSVLH